MRCDYEHEIGLITDKTNHREAYCQKRLGNYLIALYLNEDLDLQTGGLLDSFLTRALGNVRQHIMWALGTNLKKTAIDFPDSRRIRALAYWDSRFATSEVAGERTDFKGELSSIWHWCENHQLDHDWLFDRLLRMLCSGFVPAHAHDVLEWLAKVCETHVDRA
jgi:hypothetical protein